MNFKGLLSGFCLAAFVVSFAQGEESRLHPSEGLSRATCRIVGNDGNMGTVFFVAFELDSTLHVPVMVTARHVLDSIRTDSATIVFRKLNDNGTFDKVPHSVRIRKDGIAKYLVHPDTTIDLAAMVVSIPREAATTVLPMHPQYLATPDDFQKYWVHLGDKVFFLGFPLGYSSPQGDFPILRSGFVSSYPILPLKDNPNILVDADVFEGNSGGPVYIELLASQWNSRALNQDIIIIGVMSELVGVWIPSETYKEKTVTRHDLHLGGFVNTYYLHEMLDSLSANYTVVR